MSLMHIPHNHSAAWMAEFLQFLIWFFQMPSVFFQHFTYIFILLTTLANYFVFLTSNFNHILLVFKISPYFYCLLDVISYVLLTNYKRPKVLTCKSVIRKKLLHNKMCKILPNQCQFHYPHSLTSLEQL